MDSKALSAVLIVVSGAAFAADPVTVKDNGASMTLENGIVRFTLAKRGGAGRNGEGISFEYKKGAEYVELSDKQRAMYFDSGGDRIYPVVEADGQIVHSRPELGEVMWNGKPTAQFPFETEMHAVVRQGEPGVYLYAVYRHGAGMGAGSVGETRFVLRGVPGTAVFTHHIVDDIRKGPYPTSRHAQQVQDATWQLEDGSIYTKYNNTAFMADHHVHGMAGPNLGMWMMMPSNEFIGGGPYKQELTVHQGNTLLAMFVGGHFGSGGLRFAADEPWDKVYGPVFVYVNQGSSPEALWEDAKKRSAQEISKWPYTWLVSRDYPLERATVTGRIRLTDGASTAGAWAILAPPDEDWTQVIKGYDFWSKVDSQGRFQIDKVRPGRYALVVCGANQFEPFRREDVEVKAGPATDLGALDWQPMTHGRTLWQIGTADRSPGEFKDGDNYRHYDNYTRYAKLFPDDVTFIIGKSKERDDWNFAQWALYNRRPYWTIRFDAPQQLTGAATLTLGLASAIPARGNKTNLEVKVNGKLVQTVHVAKTGMAGYRSGNQDSVYNAIYVSFDAALLTKGTNEITLGHAEAQSAAAAGDRFRVPGEVMYDAIRLEVK